MTTRDLRHSTGTTIPEIAAGTHFHAQHGTKTNQVFLPADGEASWSLIQNLVSLNYQAAQCNQKTPIPVSSRQHVRFEKAKKG